MELFTRLALIGVWRRQPHRLSPVLNPSPASTKVRVPQERDSFVRVELLLVVVGGELVVITGSGLDVVQTIRFHGAGVAAIQSQSANEIRVRTPPRSLVYSVEVQWSQDGVVFAGTTPHMNMFHYFQGNFQGKPSVPDECCACRAECDSSGAKW